MMSHAATAEPKPESVIQRAMWTRRGVTACGSAFFCSHPAAAQSRPGSPQSNHLTFEVWRNGHEIGRHSISFVTSEDDLVAKIAADFVVKIGPVPVFRYRHEATETWRSGRFATLESRTSSNGSQESVQARRAASGVTILARNKPPMTVSADVAPLTHWNRGVLHAPLFNPQTGALLHEAVSRSDGAAVRQADGSSVRATGYRLAGEAEIVDWYDEQGVWAGLRGKAPDGSFLEYRRIPT